MITALVSTTALPLASAEAGSRDGWRGGYHGGHKFERRVYKYKFRKKRHHHHRGGDALAAGVIGFAIGAIIANEARRYDQPKVIYQPRQPSTRPYVHERSADYYDPIYPSHESRRRSLNEPRVIRYEDHVRYSYEPWTREWREWCDNRYRSFNASTGTFRGYDGKDHFCVVK